jgi:hypothetical protein
MEQTESTSDQNKPLFVTIILQKGATPFVLTIFILGLFATILFGTSNLPQYLSALIPLVVAALGTPIILRYFEKEEFYEDSFKLYRGRSLVATVPYSEVTEMRYSAKQIGKSKNYRSTIYLKIDLYQQDLKIVANPVNKDRKIDLLTWLRSRVSNVQEITAPSRG